MAALLDGEGAAVVDVGVLALVVGVVSASGDTAIVERADLDGGDGGIVVELDPVGERVRVGFGGVADPELATARWVAWFNRDRLHEMLGYFTPIESEAAYVHQRGLPRLAA